MSQITAGDQDLESRLQEAEARNKELTREVSKIRVKLNNALKSCGSNSVPN